MIEKFNPLIREHYHELQEILDCISVGIYITDGTGKTLLLNKESEKTGGLSKEEVIDKPMEHLLKIGYVTESSALKAISSKNRESIIQELGEGGQLYITGTPLIRNGDVELVICTERDITETIELKELLKEKEQIAGKYENELEYLRNQNLNAKGSIIGESSIIKNLIETARRVAAIDIAILLTGESGTGKELFANLIYQHSQRFNAPFIKINCAAIPENLMESEFFGYEKGAFTGADQKGKMGLFELANRGTLFLDEIGELPIQMQSKLLRALQEKEIMRIGGQEAIPVDIRIIAATNKNLDKLVKQGSFREDLYYRLNVMPLEIPPLRSRKKDIPKLAMFFVAQFNKLYHLNKTISSEALDELQNHIWPGNVRELQSMIERVMVCYEGNVISKFQVIRQLNMNKEYPPEETTNVSTLHELLEVYERSLLIGAMERNKNLTAAARELGVNKSTLSRKLKKYNCSIY